MFLLLLHFLLYHTLVGGNVHNVTQLNPFHTEFVPDKGDSKGLKVLVIVVDNRHLGDSIDGSQGFGGLAAVLQHDYCKKHNYDYIRMVNDRSQLKEQVANKYPGVVNEKFQKDVLDTIGNPKHGLDVLHPGYLRARSSSWGKLPALWYAAEKYGKRYDYIWFMDSDATPNPMQNDLSLSDALEKWDGNTTEWVKFGDVKPSDATFLFMSNFPFRDDLPCAGTIIFKPTQFAQDAIREWWDLDLIYKARDDFMEQDALWIILEAAPRFEYRINHGTTVLLTEQQFSSAWRGYQNIWFAHIPSGEEYRTGYFRTMLNVLNIRTEEQFLPLVTYIKANCVYFTSFLAITEHLETLHSKPYRVDPEENPVRSVDYVWHQPRDEQSRPPKPPLGELYNGFAYHIKGHQEVFLVYNDTRHRFPSEAAMRRMGFDWDSALQFKEHERIPHRLVQDVPLGDDVPEQGVTVQITPSYTLRPLA